MVYEKEENSKIAGILQTREEQPMDDHNNFSIENALEKLWLFLAMVKH
jgi:hypothetical protein